MEKSKTIWALVFFDLSILTITATFLPKGGSFSWTNRLEYFIKARQDWDLFWGVAVATLLLSIGVYLAMCAKGVFAPSPLKDSTKES